MKNESALRAVLTSLGFKLDAVPDLAKFLNRKVTFLYRERHEFQAFLDKQTNYCQRGTSGIDRWRHYLDERTAHKACAECGTPITHYANDYCSDACARSNSAKRAAADPEGKALAYAEHLTRKHPDYSLVEYAEPASTFRHSVCGNTFEVNNRNLLHGRAKCPCLHGKVRKQTLENLQQLFKEHGSQWIPQAFGDTWVECVNSVCGHTEAFGKRGYNVRCKLCFQAHDPQTQVVKTTEQYRRELAQSHPDLKFLGNWVSPVMLSRYKHTVCGKTFEATPEYVRRREFECPICRTAKPLAKTDVLHKVPRLGTKKKAALQYLAETTDWDLSEMAYGQQVPAVAYRKDVGTRQQMYRPPMYLPSRNLMIEVYTPYSLGLLGAVDDHSGSEMWAINCAKFKACRRAGFKCGTLLFADVRRIRMPKKWYDLDYKQALIYFRAHL